MSSFSEDELESMETGGNKRAKRVWLAGYDPDEFQFKRGDERKLKDKMQRTYVTKEWYKTKGASKKKKIRSKRSDDGARRGKSRRNDTEEFDDDEDWDDTMSTVSKKSSRSSKPVAKPAVNLIDDLLNFDNIPAPQPVEPDSASLFDTMGQPSPSQPSPAPLQQTSHRVEESAAAQGDTPVSELVDSLKGLVRKHRLQKQDLINAVTQAMDEIGLSLPSAAPQSPVDVFADAEKQITMPQQPSYGGAYQQQPPMQPQAVTHVQMHAPPQAAYQHPAPISANPFDDGDDEPAYNAADNPFASPVQEESFQDVYGTVSDQRQPSLFGDLGPSF